MRELALQGKAVILCTLVIVGCSSAPETTLKPLSAPYCAQYPTVRGCPGFEEALAAKYSGRTGHAAQFCRDHIRATAPDSRYQDNGNGTVTDLATGLIWKQCAQGLSGAGCSTGSLNSYTWQQALQHAEAYVFAGSALWRLPNKNELSSLVERRCVDPAINSRFFPNTPSSSFWSSSPNAYYSGYTWGVYFRNGSVVTGYKNSTGYVRLVRAGQ